MTDGTACGAVVDVIGPVVRARMTGRAALGDVMWVGERRLYGEVVALEGDLATLQVYESTSGLAAGAPIVSSWHPLRVQLGPGLLGSVFDGLQRPLDRMAQIDGAFFGRGSRLIGLDPDRLWRFEPDVRAGDEVQAGAVVGHVAETPALEHRVLVPPGVAGRVLQIAHPGDYRIADTIAQLATGGGGRTAIALSHFWPARTPRPIQHRLALDTPLITGQRVLDTFFPVSHGGTVGMPGGFGTGKTVLQHQLCKWADADVIVFIGCCERGNEMADVLSELPALTDARTGRPLSSRTVLIANTSDMPVAAREASIYVGATIAEYYRDMGFRVLLLADSTSRWAEALREISGRLEEMPAEEGYPPYLASRLAAFYERAGRVTTLGGREGALTMVGAISPPGGDLTEPVTRHTERLTRVFWTLDRALADARRFPAVSTIGSHSDGAPRLAGWWQAQTGADWSRLRDDALALVDEAERLEATARLIGTSSLPGRQQLALAFARIFQDAFLRQSAGAQDDYCSPRRQVRLLELLLHVRDLAIDAEAAGVTVAGILSLPVLADIRRASMVGGESDVARLDRLETQFERDCRALFPESAA
ncbi:MAG TPA: V-type ATP synthase subunit A [Vicinamibacterales bacterium]|nr:V-type ATP synthase subunit A [Vicinamibacterales bacterium]